MPEPLKDRYDTNYISRLAAEITAVAPLFPADEFISLILNEGWEARELKQRMTHITLSLGQTLPANYRTALAILAKVAPCFHGFEGMFIPEFVERYGIDDWDASLPALATLTQYASSEFAVRPFIKQDRVRMMTRMSAWAEDENVHVRRLASEGCRPRLPWAMALPEFKRDPSPVLPILEILKDDPEEYVRRSVANNLNDIAKDHPGLVLSIAESWLGQSQERDRLVKHACRTLLKAGHPEALALFGFVPEEGVAITALDLEKTTIRIGEIINFSFMLTCKQVCRLRLEYAIEYVKSGGKKSRKIFKISEREYPAGSTSIKRHQAFSDLSTRKHYPGRHGLVIHINGLPLAETSFLLEAKHPPGSP